MVLSVQDRLHEARYVDNAILNDIMAELVHLERKGIVLKGMQFDVRVVELVMDAPALCRFVALMGHQTNYFCPLCLFASRSGQHVEKQDKCKAKKRASSEASHSSPDFDAQSFALTNPSSSAINNLHLRTNKHWRDGV